MATTDEVGALLSYSLPTPEHDAMERVGIALGTSGGAAVVRAVCEFIDAGGPRTWVPPPIGAIPREQFGYYVGVCWWLRRSPALEILAPAALFEEARLDELERHDTARMQRTLLQVGRIAGDRLHPLRAEARRLLLSVIPETHRSQAAARYLTAELAAAAPKGEA